jgi:hypothetical protein
VGAEAACVRMGDWPLTSASQHRHADILRLSGGVFLRLLVPLPIAEQLAQPSHRCHCLGHADLLAAAVATRQQRLRGMRARSQPDDGGRLVGTIAGDREAQRGDRLGQIALEAGQHLRRLRIVGTLGHQLARARRPDQPHRLAADPVDRAHPAGLVEVPQDHNRQPLLTCQSHQRRQRRPRILIAPRVDVRIQKRHQRIDHQQLCPTCRLRSTSSGTSSGRRKARRRSPALPAQMPGAAGERRLTRAHRNRRCTLPAAGRSKYRTCVLEQ